MSLGAAGGTLSLTYKPPATGTLAKATVPGVRLLGQITGGGNLTIAGGTAANNPVNGPYLYLLDNLTNNFTGSTTIRNATVINDAGVSAATNLLPATTVLTLANSAVFAFYGTGGATQTLAGLSGDGSAVIGTANTTTPASLTINPAANASLHIRRHHWRRESALARQQRQRRRGTIVDCQRTGDGGLQRQQNRQRRNDHRQRNTLSQQRIARGRRFRNGGRQRHPGGLRRDQCATVINGKISPAIGNSLSFANGLTLNAGATFVLQAGGGIAGSVQNVSNLTANGQLYLVPAALDSNTLNGSNSFQFLTWTGSGPAPGIQSNWTILGANIISWTGAADQSSWSNSGNWSGSNVSGGTVQAGISRRQRLWPRLPGSRRTIPIARSDARLQRGHK